jgi:signal transduction histidine kinase
MSSTADQRLFAARPTSGPLIDVGIAAVALAGTLAQLNHGGVFPARPGSGEFDRIGIVLAVFSTVPLIAWRRIPLGVFAATAAASVALAGLAYPVDLLLGPTAALYLLAAGRGRDTPWTGRTTATVVGLLAAYLGAAAAARGAIPGSELLHTGLAWAGAWFAGERTRLRRERIADLRQRALRAEREAARERQLAVAEERTRIARDLHDSAGHAISVIAVRAGAARLRHHQDPQRSLAALEAIEELARHTAEEIDQLVGSLREASEDGEVDAPPGLASLDTLVAHYAATGLQITVETSGTPPTLGTASDQAIFRILQEALTNAARHGTGGARIALTFGDAAVDFTVTNPVRADRTPRPGGGHGLIGMRERATLLGGNLHAERVDGRFDVRGRIPYGGHRP